MVVPQAKTAFELIPAVFAGLLDRGGEFPDRTGALEIHRARTVRVEADPPMEVQYDGEATRLTTPFSARILPRAARFYVSEEGWELFAQSSERVADATKPRDDAVVANATVSEITTNSVQYPIVQRMRERAAGHWLRINPTRDLVYASSQRARVRGDSAPLRSHEDAEGCPVGADNMRFVLPIAVPERKREDDARTAQNNITKSRSAYRHQSLPAFPPFQGSDPRGATSELASFNQHRSYFSTRDNNGSSRISFGGDGHEKLAGPRSGQDIGQLLAHRYGGRPVGGIKRLDNTKVERLFV